MRGGCCGLSPARAPSQPRCPPAFPQHICSASVRLQQRVPWDPGGSAGPRPWCLTCYCPSERCRDTRGKVWNSAVTTRCCGSVAESFLSATMEREEKERMPSHVFIVSRNSRVPLLAWHKNGSWDAVVTELWHVSCCGSAEQAFPVCVCMCAHVCMRV